MLKISDKTADQRLAEELNDYGCKCKDTYKFLGAKAAFLQAHKLDPKNHLVLTNLGATYWNLHEFEISTKCLHEAIALSPNYWPAHANLGLVYSAQSMFEESMKHLDEAIRIAPKEIGPRWDKMITYLDMGEWKKGFDDYDIRFAHKTEDYIKLPYEVWTGEQDLNNKTLFVQAEQGVGDRISFSRYLPMIKQKYPTCKIIFLTESHTQPLFWQFREDEWIDEFIPYAVPYPKADYGIYMMSLLKIFGISLDNVPPPSGLLLKGSRQLKKHCNLISTRGNPKIGVVWGGNPKFALDYWRSVPFTEMAKLFELSDYTFFSFQVGVKSEDIRDHGFQGIVQDLSPIMENHGWSGTMMCLQQMDLVITCDSAIAHLAGEMGIPVWNLLYFANYWQWLREGETTKWYPTMRLFRQDAPGDWASSIEKVKIALKEYFGTDFVYSSDKESDIIQSSYGIS